MARLVFPDDTIILRPGAPGSVVRNAAGATATVYTDAAGTTLADIQQLDGTAIVNSELPVDAFTRLPYFLGPDGVDTLYVQVDKGPFARITARVDDRLDLVEPKVVDLQTKYDSMAADLGPRVTSNESRLTTIEGGWTAYTPVWTSNGTAPAVGNGLIDGRYRKIGKVAFVRGILRMGSSTTYGTGTYSMSLPSVLPADAAVGKTPGSLFLWQSGGASNPRGGICAISNATTLWLISAAGGDITNTNPWTWASGGEIHWNITYQTTA